MSDEAPRHRGRAPRSRRIAKRALIVVAVIAMVLSGAFVIIYKKLEGNIHTIAMPEGPRPKRVVEGPLNVLVMGSDSREGANGSIGGETPGLGDVTMLLHLSADRKFAYGVSLPRDAMIERPACPLKDGGGTDPGGLTQFNAAYAVGGPACVLKTVETLTGIHVDHFVAVEFVGFKSMVDALGGVEICVPTDVDDTIGHIQLPAGTYEVDGTQALDYVRVRHGLGAPTADIGRMKRQQAFVSSMIEKVVSAGTLANPLRLIKFLDAATKALTTDPGFASLKKLASLGNSLQGIGLDKIQFITVPWQPYPPDINRIEWKNPEARQLWRLIKNDRELTSELAEDAVSPGSGKSGGKSGGKTGGKAGGKATPTDEPTRTQEEKDAAAEAAGLCT